MKPFLKKFANIIQEEQQQVIERMKKHLHSPAKKKSEKKLPQRDKQNSQIEDYELLSPTKNRIDENVSI